MDDLPIYEEIIRLKKARIPAALATVVETKGSSPRKAGAKMIIQKDGAITGTIGGGRTEADTIAAAKEVIRQGTPRTISFSLTEEHGAVCGGSIVIYLEPLIVPCHLIVIGDGHVGKAVTQAAHQAGFLASMISLTDTKTDTAMAAAVVHHPLHTLPAALNEIGADANTYIFIATSDHQKDFQAVSAALETNACYIAVLGSKKKKVAMEKYLLEKEFTHEAISRIVSPAGLDIGAETPAEIAVSIVGQMIKTRRSGSAARSSHSACGRTIKTDGPQQTVAAAGR
jgi:xanthine dehydrogenase accessory factor